MEEFDITAPLQSETLKDSELNSLFPKKILKYIFSLLPPPDLKAAVMVCKLWAEVGQAPELWNWAAFDMWHASESMLLLTNAANRPQRNHLRTFEWRPVSHSGPGPF